MNDYEISHDDNNTVHRATDETPLYYLLDVEADLIKVATNRAAGTMDKPNKKKWIK